MKKKHCCSKDWDKNKIYLIRNTEQFVTMRRDIAILFSNLIFHMLKTHFLLLSMVKQLCCLIFLWKLRRIFFRFLWWIESSKEQHLF